MCGLVLPVWQAINNTLLRQPTERQRQLRVVRCVIPAAGDANDRLIRRFVGIVIHEAGLDM